MNDLVSWNENKKGIFSVPSGRQFHFQLGIRKPGLFSFNVLHQQDILAQQTHQIDSQEVAGH